MIILILGLWFSISKQTIPFHALAAFMSLLVTWTMYCFSQEVRKLVQTKLFIFGTIFSVVQTAIFEFYHAGIGQHWIYLPQNEIASLHPMLHFTFPCWAGAVPNSWPIEEWCAYPTLFVFVMLYLIFFQTTLKISILKHTIVIEENHEKK